MLVLWQVVTGLNQLSEKEQLAEAWCWRSVP